MLGIDEPMKFLVINDSSEIIDLLSLCFKLHWPEVELLSAIEGKMGLVLVRQQGPELVILDINLPDANGLEVLQELRSFSDVPVVILSVSDEQEADIDHYMEEGATDYIVMPFDYVDFIERCRGALDQKRGPARSSVLSNVGDC